ncbi:MAG TPA: hypothetical protein VJ813_09335 [Vicinamibacterales bacterium]|nr:hypothetical protein [Vicinamibacterales bacterium]
MQKSIPCLAVSLLLGLAGVASAQAPTAGPSRQPAAGEVPLKVDLVVSRYAGQKKVSSIPFTVSVVANDNDKTSLRMGVDVPVPQTVFSGGPNTSVPTTSYSYRSVGTNIDCTARTVEGGWFKLDLAVSDSSVFIPEKEGAANPGRLGGVPAFRSFTSTFNLLLKDGQTSQHTSATDPVSGEVLRIDVTVNVLK